MLQRRVMQTPQAHNLLKTSSTAPNINWTRDNTSTTYSALADIK